MLRDRYSLTLSTTSSVARDAYVEGCDRILTLFPGATDAFDRAIAADPRFALAHAGKARAHQIGGDIDSASKSLATAKTAAGEPREISQIKIFELMLAGQSNAALAAVRAHLEEWPRDAVVLSTSASQLGLIGLSSRAGLAASRTL